VLSLKGFARDTSVNVEEYLGPTGRYIWALETGREDVGQESESTSRLPRPFSTTVGLY
jgi:hypothetical protein